MNVDWLGMISSTGTAAKIVVVIVLIVILLGLLGWWIFRLIVFNKECVIKNVTGGGTPLRERDFAWQRKNKETNALYWTLKKRKVKIPRPPPSAIGLTRNGREYAEFYDLGKGKDNLIPIDQQMKDFSQEKTFIETAKPLTESQRSYMIHQIKKSTLGKKLGLMELLHYATPFIALVLILAVFLLFLGDGMKPIIEQAKIAKEGATDFRIAAETMERAVEKLDNVQVIGSRPPTNITPPR